MAASKVHLSPQYIVGVGASAGGLEALTAFVSNLPADFPGAVIVAQHLAPHVKSMMVELLSKQSALPIFQAGDEAPIGAGTIYIAPPNSNINVSGERIFLTVPGPDKKAKPSVDDFFISLAKARGAQAVGIILSGTGSDGSEGIRAIYAAGGLTLAQDGFSAKYDGMPQAAIDTSCIDFILSPEEMGKKLVSLIAEHGLNKKEDILQSAEWKECLKLLEAQGGTDFSRYRSSTIRRRLIRRMSQVHISDLKDYLDLLQHTPGEVNNLAQELLVSVTSFFRDPEVFAELRVACSELMAQKRHGEELRVWVAGCATGEEAYSMAMMLADLQDHLRRSLVVKVFATDLDQDAIVDARQGFYDEAQLQALPPGFFQRYFEPRGGGRFEVNKRIRDMVVFARQDMIQNPPFVRLDVVTCRNVLIYFEQELQNKVLEIFHYALLPDGILCLGKSESLGKSAELFETVSKKCKIFRRLEGPPSFHLSKPTTSTPLTPYIPVTRRREPRSLLLEKGLLRILQEFDLAGVIIDRDMNIVQVLGDVSPHISFSSSQADLRLLHLLPKSAGAELPLLIRKAGESAGSCKGRWHRREDEFFRMTILPVDPQENSSLQLVTFERRRAEEDTKTPALPPGMDPDLPGHVMEIEQELLATREHLQTVIEELGVANEELQSLNEELSSTNEELQSTNEELETANEELQSSNEELTTVNEELNMKSVQMRELTTSLQNVQESIGAGLLVVDQNFKVVRFNRNALNIFLLSGADIGRDVRKISARCELPEFNEHLQDVIKSGRSFEFNCETQGAWYAMRMLPFRDEGGKIIGAILLFHDETAVMKTRQKLQISENQIRSIVEGFSSPISLKDQHGRYLMVNSSFLNFHQLKLDQVLGKMDRDLFDDDHSNRYREADLEVMYRGEQVRREEAVRRPDGTVHYFLVNRFPLYDGRKETPYAIGMVSVDITAQKEAQDELAENEARYRAIVEDQAVLVCRILPDGKLIFANHLFEAQFQDFKRSVLGRHFHEFVAYQDIPRAQTDLRSLSARHPIQQVEYRVFRKDGGMRWLRWVFKGIFDPAGQLLEIQAVGFDVTEYRARTDFLSEKQAMFSTILSNTTDIVAILQKKGNDFELEYLNRVGQETLEARTKIVGKTLRQFRSSERAQWLQEHFSKSLDLNQTFTFEDLWRHDHDRFFLNTVVPLKATDGGDGDRVAVICKEISDHKRIENDLRVAKDAAEVANRAKSDFLASMSHELRTPLNVVLGMSTLLSETPLDVDQAHYVGSIERSGKALLSLIEDILDISKIESGKIKLSMDTFKLSDLILETTRIFETPAREKNIGIEIDIEREADTYVIGDAGRLRQVLVNLVGNALKFTDKGKICIRARGGQEFPGEREFYFEVEDTGIGIREGDRAKIFKKFSQVESGHSRRFGGTGLGLIISKQIAQMMKGEMGFDSQEGQGSTFWFKVRLHLASERDLEAKRRREAFTKESQKEPVLMRVLAVDDNKESLNIIRLFMQKLGHTVFTASRGREAIETIKREKVDLVLMDVQMPEMDGYETTRLIREDKEISPNLPILALTANAMTGDAEKCLQAGMNDYLTKPVRMDLLKDMLSRWSSRVAGEELS